MHLDALVDPPGFDHQGAQVAALGVAAETPTRVLFHQAHPEGRPQSSRRQQDNGAGGLSLHLQTQIHSRGAVEQRTVDHNVVPTIRPVAPQAGHPIAGGCGFDFRPNSGLLDAGDDVRIGQETGSNG